MEISTSRGERGGRRAYRSRYQEGGGSNHRAEKQHPRTPRGVLVRASQPPLGRRLTESRRGVKIMEDKRCQGHRELYREPHRHATLGDARLHPNPLQQLLTHVLEGGVIVGPWRRKETGGGPAGYIQPRYSDDLRPSVDAKSERLVSWTPSKLCDARVKSHKGWSEAKGHHVDLIVACVTSWAHSQPAMMGHSLRSTLKQRLGYF